MLISEALSLTEGVSSDTPKLDVELLLSEVLQVNRTYLYTWPDKSLTDAQETQFKALLAQRVSGKPIAHLLGYRAFWSFDLEVNDKTLIPRPDTELLVETALTLFDDQPIDALDLGSGTGAIALALASERPAWKLLGVDRIDDAVALAQRNASKLGITNIRFAEGSWFEPVTHAFDLIVSNPPYIDPQDQHLSQGDVRFEPLSALVAADSGRADLALIIEQAPGYLNPGGWLVLEHGYDQAEWVAEKLSEQGFSNLKQLKDLGGNMRVSAGQWLGN